MPRHIPTAPVARLLGQLIRERRRSLELTQEDLVARSGVDISFVSRVERGLTTPSVAVLIHLAKGLDTTAAKLTAELERLLEDRKANRSRHSRGST